MKIIASNFVRRRMAAQNRVIPISYRPVYDQRI